MELKASEPLYPRNLGDLLRENRQWEPARQAYEQALAIDADYAPAVNGLGLLHQARGEVEKAAALFRKAMGLNSKEPAFPRILGDVLRESRQWEAARQAYEQALAIDHDSAYAINGLGLLHQARGELEKAAELYRKAMRLDPKSPIYPRILGDLLVE